MKISLILILLVCLVIALGYFTFYPLKSHQGTNQLLSQPSAKINQVKPIYEDYGNCAKC